MIQETELNFKAKKTSEKVSENLHIFANDPSLAFFRIQEHVRKVLPPITSKETEVVILQNNLQGHCYDMEYAVGALKFIETSEAIFQNIQESLKTSIFLSQQLKYEEVRNKSKKDTSKNSVYKRLSAHLLLDFPELPDFSGARREPVQHPETSAGSNRSQLVPQNSLGDFQRSHTTLH